MTKHNDNDQRSLNELKRLDEEDKQDEIDKPEVMKRTFGYFAITVGCSAFGYLCNGKDGGAVGFMISMLICMFGPIIMEHERNKNENENKK